MKSRLLKRKFQSLEYIEQFIGHYQQFLDTGLSALTSYKDYKKQNPTFVPTKLMDTDEWLWDIKVRPNFLRMHSSSVKAMNFAKKNNMDYVDGLAGDMRGLSRSMDGIREAFMDILDPSVKEEYLSLWKITSREARNIEKTINQWWKEDSILKESITGPIDEQELKNYLQPGESL
ncbi:hypothetical protein [Endozoicomonas numazuensis]|nr:hypothetical protein [Endozoicomonas numazuensis]